jgi:Protein of unknown function (DUF4038)/Domain of unknown function (DUF5060)/Putative collagen-binding domain of a collagenase
LPEALPQLTRSGRPGVAKRASLVIGFCLLVLATTVHAEPIPLWGRWEQSFNAGTIASPETELFVELISPSDRVVTVAGFWDGEETWRVRFMPDEAGTWRYRTRSNPVVKGLHGKTGDFVSRPGAPRTPFLRHGAVRVSANGRFFEHADGTPFFWMGDTVWYGAILSSTADWNTYLVDRAQKGFSVAHFNAIAPRNGVAADENGEVSFSGGFEHLRVKSRLDRLKIRARGLVGLSTEPVRMNPRFYRRLDERVDAINARGLLAAIVITWGLRQVDSGNALPEAEVVRVIRYLESRYGANHVAWVMTGDADYEGASGERWKRIGRAAFGGRAHRPVTTHPRRMLWPWESFASEEWLDFIVYQSGHWDDPSTLSWIHSGPPRQHWADPPPRPLINIEPPYEGHLGIPSGVPHSDYAVRRAIYWSLLNAPTTGVTYGAHGIWSWQTVVGQPPTDHANTGIAKTWREALSFPGGLQMKHVQNLFRSVAWWTLRPDGELLAEQLSVDPAVHISASRSEDGSLAVFYLPVGGGLQIREGALRERLRSEWFDPRTGRMAPARPRGRGLFQAPDQQDWVLLLRDTGSTPRPVGPAETGAAAGAGRSRQ